MNSRSAFLPFYFICFLCLFSSCNTRYEIADNPCPLPECAPLENVRLAIVLGGGGARGLSHVGVLEEFQKVGLPIDAIVGCSAGSLVGVLYCDCMDLKTIRSVLEPLRKWDIIDFNLFKSRYGFVQGYSLERFLHKNLRSRTFEELQIPFYAVATDIRAGELVTIGSGPLIPAVRASAAVPLVFCPVILHDRMLVDGGVVDPVPVKSAKGLGAQVIVAVDLSELLPKTCPTNLFGIASRSAELKFLMQSESCVQGADVVIRPELGCMSMFDDDNHEMAYKAGQIAARQALPEIIQLLSEKGVIDRDYAANCLACIESRD